MTINKDIFQSYFIELRRGSLTLSVLGCLNKPYYGYSLLQTMQDIGIDIEANTLYPLLRRLETQCLLTSDWDTTDSRPRKYYTISTLGESVYQELLKEFEKMNSNMTQIAQSRGEQNEK